MYVCICISLLYHEYITKKKQLQRIVNPMACLRSTDFLACLIIGAALE